jgi:hypothetical protein
LNAKIQYFMGRRSGKLQIYRSGEVWWSGWRADLRELGLRLGQPRLVGRIAVSEIEAPNLFVNLVLSG